MSMEVNRTRVGGTPSNSCGRSWIFVYSSKRVEVCRGMLKLMGASLEYIRERYTRWRQWKLLLASTVERSTCLHEKDPIQ